MAAASRVNEWGQPIGEALDGWTAAEEPPADLVLVGEHVTLKPLQPQAHAAELFEAVSALPSSWTYLPQSPCASVEQFAELLGSLAGAPQRRFFVVVCPSGAVVGYLSLLNINAAHGSIEIGYIHFGPRLQRSTGATETVYLLLQWAFQSGYRRVEWKCDALNAPSRAAALRFGFTFEGVHRQAVVYKGRNRDTAWFSIVDSDWPPIQHAFEQWLSPANFDEHGRQLRSLAALRSSSTFA